LTSSDPSPATTVRVVVSGDLFWVPRARRWALLLAATLGILVDGLTSSTTTVALPYLQGQFALGPDESSWIVTVYNTCYYTAVLATVILMGRYGTKHVLIAALGGSVIASLLLTVALSPSILLLVRALQGAFVGAIYVSAAYTIWTSFPPPRLVTVAFAIFSLAILQGPTIGPYLAGVAVDTLGWRSIYVVNAFPAALATLIAVLASPDAVGEKRHRLDFVGVVLAVAVFASFQFAMNEGTRRDWLGDETVTIALVSLPFLLAAFITWKLQHARHPMLDLRLLSHGAIPTGGALALALGFILGATTVTQQYAQAALSYTPTYVGFMLLLRVFPLVLGIVVSTYLSVSKRLSAGQLVALGLTLLAVGYFLQAQETTTESPLFTFMLPSAVVAFGLAFAFQPLPGIMVGGVPRYAAAEAVTIMKFGLLVGASIATAVNATLLQHATAQHLADLAGTATLASPAWRALSPRLISSATAALNQQATALAYRDVLATTALAAAAAVPLTLGLFRSTPRSRQTGRVETSRAAPRRSNEPATADGKTGTLRLENTAAAGGNSRVE